jgi:hypothetical protein
MRITYNDFLVDGVQATGTAVDEERGQAHDNDSASPVLSVVFFLPAFISPFMPSSLSRFVLAIDVIFSYHD